MSNTAAASPSQALTRTPGQRLRALADDPKTTYDQVRELLSALTPDERRIAIRSVGGRKRQKHLFQLAESGPPVTVEDMVQSEKGTMQPVIFHGKNSLPMFTHFQKRFCRAPGSTEGATVLYGYNHQAMAWLVGPGYFIAKNSQDPLGQVAIDYYEVPPEKPESWPAIKANEGIRAGAVYGKMVDYLRELAPGVLIGRAVKNGKVTDNYFLLAREA